MYINKIQLNYLLKITMLDKIVNSGYCKRCCTQLKMKVEMKWNEKLHWKEKKINFGKNKSKFINTCRGIIQ